MTERQEVSGNPVLAQRQKQGRRVRAAFRGRLFEDRTDHGGSRKPGFKRRLNVQADRNIC